MIPAHIDTTKAPRIWVKNGMGVGVRVIDPAWLRRMEAGDEDGAAKLTAAVERRVDEKLERDVATRVRAYRSAVAMQSVPTCMTFEQAQPNARSIMREIAALYGVTVSDIRGKSRTKLIVKARQHAIYEAKRRKPHLSLPQLGEIFGGRDHTTILHALNAWPKKAEAIERDAA